MDESVKEALEKIDSLVADADDRAIYLIKKEARKILESDPNLDEFVMAMGGCFFTIKEGGKYDSLSYTDEEWELWCETDEYVRTYYNIISDDDNFQKEFFSMVEDLNEKFKVCGYPVRFKANTEEVHEWGDTIKNPIEYKYR
jgi:hypothetical protein